MLICDRCKQENADIETTYVGVHTKRIVPQAIRHGVAQIIPDLRPIGRDLCLRCRADTERHIDEWLKRELAPPTPVCVRCRGAGDLKKCFLGIVNESFFKNGGLLRAYENDACAFLCAKCEDNIDGMIQKRVKEGSQ